MQFFTPDQNGKWPGVVLLPGSDGGVPVFAAKKLAFQGFTVLPLGYFGTEGLPQRLENISLNELKQKILEFSQSSQVQKGGVSLVGYSRGGELALLLGSLFPELFKNVVSIAPSAFVGGGFPFPNRPAWLLDGSPVGFTPNGLMSQDEDFSELDDLQLSCKTHHIPYHANTKEDPFVICDLFEARDAALQEKTSRIIPVEKIACPVLLLAGEDDLIWPSARYVLDVQKRLDEHRSPIARKVLIYPNAGHGILAPYPGGIYHPQGKFWCALGGSLDGNNAAYESSWFELIQFITFSL